MLLLALLLPIGVRGKEKTPPGDGAAVARVGFICAPGSGLFGLPGVPLPAAGRRKLLLDRSDGVLGDLGDAELDHGLGLDLDGLAGLGVATEASLALCLHQLADAGNGELAILLGLLDGGLSEGLEKSRG